VIVRYQLYVRFEVESLSRVVESSSHSSKMLAQGDSRLRVKGVSSRRCIESHIESKAYRTRRISIFV